VTIETEEKAVLRGGQDRHSTLMWCPACRRQVEMVTPAQGARVAGVSERTIYRWVEARKLHFDEVPDRTMFICLDSLRAAVVTVDKSA
jgi:hypothetical protein